MRAASGHFADSGDEGQRNHRGREQRASGQYALRPGKADRGRRAEYRIRRSRPGRRPGSRSSARLALRHSQLRRCRPAAGRGGLPGDRPVLRGYGTTRFLSERPVRNGQQVGPCRRCHRAHGRARIEQAILAGFDWGARTAGIVAALWPERCKALVSVSGYLIGNQEAGKAPLPPQAEYGGGTSTTSPPSAAGPATPSTGASSASSSGRLASPQWAFDDATFDAQRGRLRQP